MQQNLKRAAVLVGLVRLGSLNQQTTFWKIIPKVDTAHPLKVSLLLFIIYL